MSPVRQDPEGDARFYRQQAETHRAAALADANAQQLPGVEAALSVTSALLAVEARLETLGRQLEARRR